jgi:hypothetical protein
MKKIAYLIILIVLILVSMNITKLQNQELIIRQNDLLIKQQDQDEQKKEIKIETNLIMKSKFDKIYESKIWGPEGHGSGPGSTIEFTTNCRNIVYNLVKKYKINSILDAPCGAMAWMPLLLRNLTQQITNFKYHGIDVVESVIDSLKIKYNNETNWLFSLHDVTRQPLPPNYDLITSRDALQHLPLDYCVDALKAYSRTIGARYLLIGSYI